MLRRISLVFTDHRRSTHTNYLIQIVKERGRSVSLDPDRALYAVCLIRQHPVAVLPSLGGRRVDGTVPRRCALYAPSRPGQQPCSRNLARVFPASLSTIPGGRPSLGSAHYTHLSPRCNPPQRPGVPVPSLSPPARPERASAPRHANPLFGLPAAYLIF
jgi:hypothetical protein